MSKLRGLGAKVSVLHIRTSGGAKLGIDDFFNVSLTTEENNYDDTR